MKTILITGASGGIGSEIAKKFDNPNNRLILIGNKNKIALEQLQKTIKTNSMIFSCDLSNEENIKNIIDEVVLNYKKIDVLINCAGVSLIKQIQDTTTDDYNHIFNNNLKSTIMLTSAVSKNMISNQNGKIVNISSMWGVVGASMESLYSASKGAINSFTLALAKELGPSNITVNAVCPGLINTAMNANIEPSALKEIVDNTPLGKIGASEDVANLVEFLTSDKANFITGQIITIDGGFSL